MMYTQRKAERWERTMRRYLTDEELRSMSVEEINEYTMELEKQIVGKYQFGVFERPSQRRKNRWKRRLNKIGFNFKIQL